MTREQQRSAFTLVELLVVLGVLGILASLLLRSVFEAAKRSQQVACINNIRQLGIAFGVYCEDYMQTFPAAASRTTYGPHDEDWIWWQQTRDFKKSAIAPYVGTLDNRLVTCPAHGLAKRMQAQHFLQNDPFRYSYSITSYQIDNDYNPGIATIIADDDVVYPFRSFQIQNPTRKYMLVEENELDDGRWVPADWADVNKGWVPRRLPFTNRHGKKADVGFADLHVEAVPSEAVTNLLNSHPGL